MENKTENLAASIGAETQKAVAGNPITEAASAPAAKRAPSPDTSAPARKTRTQRPPDLHTR